MFEKLIGREPGILDREELKEFAVIVPFLPETRELLFEVRAGNLHRQPGEICFPGGLIEPGESPLQAAVRETTEELLVGREQLSVIAPLDILFRPAGDSVVHPFLAELGGYDGRFSGEEVAEVFAVPFSFFLETEPKVFYNRITVAPDDPDFPHDLISPKPYSWSKGRYPVIFYLYKNRVIWGMTARFVNNLVKLCRE